jgi:hypothetical protein
VSSWALGREAILKLIAAGELELVQPNPIFAKRLIDDAKTHLNSAGAIANFDFSGAFQLGYDAARKACAALLAEQGLRSTQKDGHVAVADAVRAQFNGPKGSPVFTKMHDLRRARASSEYPSDTTPPITQDDATYYRGAASGIINAAKKVLSSGHLGTFVP